MIPGILIGLLAAARAAAAEQVGTQAQRLELTNVQKQLEETRRQIEEYKKLEQSLGGELHDLKSRNEEERRKMQQLQRNLRLAEAKKDTLKSRLGALGQASGFWKSELAADLRGYVAARASRTEAYGTTELWAEAFRRAAILEKTRLMGGFAGISKKTQAAEVESARQARDLENKSRKAQAEQQSREEELRKKQAAISDAQKKRAEAIKRAEELAATAKALTKLLKTFRAASSGKASAPKLELSANALPWPAAGRVVQRFGRERNPQLDTWVIHQGVTIQTALDAAVAAVRPGRVIFAGPFRSYGEVMIVDHGDNFFSVYGELGSPLKQKGAQVAAGEAIARAGQGEDGKGRLYLELRRGTEALDPMIWLQKR